MANMNDVDMSNAGELMDGFQVIPPGEYVMYLEESERKLNKAGDGEYLNCTFVVADGAEQGAKIFKMFLLWNKSQKARDIAKAEWRALCEAAVGQPFAPNNDSSSLNFKKFVAEVKQVPAVMDENNPTVVKYPAKNELVFRKGTIRSVNAQGSAPVGVANTQSYQQPAQAAAQAQQAAPAAAPSTGGRPAWAKR